MSATVFYRKFQTEAERTLLHLQQSMTRTESQRLWFMLELVAISLRFSHGKTLKSGNKDGILNPQSHIIVDLFQQDIFDFFKALAIRQCRFLVVGGFAVNAHGYSRATGDLDIWIEDTVPNRHRLVAAAQDCQVAGAEYLLTMEFVPGWSGFTLCSGFEVELMSYIAGFQTSDFNLCYQQAKVVDIEGFILRFLQLDDLIKAKEAINRNKDQEDIRQLYEIRKLSS